MKIVSWNCHYGLTNEKMERLLNFESNAGVYLIQEVKENDIINLEKFKFRHWYGDHAEFGDCHKPRANSGDLGIAILSNNYKIQRIDEGRERYRYVLPYFVSDGKEKVIIIHVWTKSFPEYYSEAITPALQYYSAEFKNKHIIMMGDFNFGRKIDDNFFTIFDSNLEKSDFIKPINFIKSNNTDTFYQQKSETKYYYFNDCLYHSKNLIVKSYNVGEKSEWLKEDSDHCPIMAELELK